MEGDGYIREEELPFNCRGTRPHEAGAGRSETEDDEGEE